MCTCPLGTILAEEVVNLEVEMTVQERIFSERRRQFEQSISNIDVINHKCHDLKYQIQALKSEELSANKKMAIDEITNAVNFYDDSFQTDNEILNAALMEKVWSAADTISPFLRLWMAKSWIYESDGSVCHAWKCT